MFKSTASDNKAPSSAEVSLGGSTPGTPTANSAASTTLGSSPNSRGGTASATPVAGSPATTKVGSMGSDTSEVPELQESHITFLKKDTGDKSVEKKTALDKAEWVSCGKGGDAQVHAGFFKQGLLVLKSGSVSQVSGPEIQLGTRTLLFSGKNDTNRIPQKTKSLMSSLQALCSQQVNVNNAESNAERKNSAERLFIFNPKRREEVFPPIIVPDLKNSGKPIGFYAYPWVHKNLPDLSKGISNFVMASCIFGDSLRALDSCDKEFPLIKHDLQFAGDEKIVTVEYNPRGIVAYETVWFAEFEKILSLINGLSGSQPNVTIYYHLPYYDYILFGVELFIRGRMTLDALDELCSVMIDKKQEYESKLDQILQPHKKVKIAVASPFENIFGPFDPKTLSAKSILKTLGVSDQEVKPNNNSNKNDSEAALVAHCLQVLQQNNSNTEQQAVWKDFIQVTDPTAPISNLEDLFKMANAVMIGVAAKRGQGPTCSLLPVSEKQIQVSFGVYANKLSKQYPEVINLTMVDPVVTYDKGFSKGLLFYFKRCERTLADLIDQDILSTIHRNVADPDAEIDLATFLERGKSSI